MHLHSNLMYCLFLKDAYASLKWTIDFCKIKKNNCLAFLRLLHELWIEFIRKAISNKNKFQCFETIVVSIMIIYISFVFSIQLRKTISKFFICATLIFHFIIFPKSFNKNLYTSSVHLLY